MKRWSLPFMLVAAHALYAAQAPNSEPRSVREILGKVQPLAHTQAQVRVGYIDWQAKGATAGPDNSAFAVGGHIHIDSKRWHGLMVGSELYVVADPGFDSDDPAKVNPDFFDADKNGFAALSQAFIDGKWDRTEIKIGRQMLDTPHADSDDIRMMPNYFLAYMLTNRSIEGLTLRLGQIDQMGGWENGIDASRFVPVEKALGAPRKTDGIYVASAAYEGGDNLSLQAWYYDFTDIADVIYLEAGYDYAASFADLTFGLQYDGARDRGDKLLGDIQSNTWGASLEAGFDNGVTLIAAYNEETGDTGAFGSLGGGPFFTSMEDQTIDAIGAKGYALMGAVGYDFGALGLDGLNAGIAYGHFEADQKSDYETDETDFALSYALQDRISIDALYAVVDDKTAANEDSDLFRITANYNFATGAL